jgi:hypothetical protein
VQPRFRWPTHKDLTFIKPPLKDENLHDALDPNIDRWLEGEVEFTDEKFIRDTYGRLYDPRLDGTWEEALYAWGHCHNGLWKARRKDLLTEVEVYYLAERLVSLAQYAAGDAPLDLHKEGKWFLLPGDFTIRAQSSKEQTCDLNQFGEFFGELEKAKKIRERFNKAKVTVHLVHHINHWGVLFFQPATGATCYVDSQYTKRHGDTQKLQKAREKKKTTIKGEVKRRCKVVREALDSWSARSGLPRPDFNKNLCASSPDQEDSWSCGFQVVANILAFIRYGAVGWHRVEHWAAQCRSSRRRAVMNMRRELIICLHNIMGLRLGNTVLDQDKGDQEDDEDLFADGMPGEDSDGDAGGDGYDEDPISYNASTGKRASSTTGKSDRVTRGDKVPQPDAARPTTKAQEDRARKQREMTARLAELREMARKRSEAMEAALKAGKPFTLPEEGEEAEEEKQSRGRPGKKKKKTDDDQEAEGKQQKGGRKRKGAGDDDKAGGTTAKAVRLPRQMEEQTKRRATRGQTGIGEDEGPRRSTRLSKRSRQELGQEEGGQSEMSGIKRRKI